jgi:hypothetical protein
MKPRVTWSEEVAERILAGLTEGLGLRVICRQPGMPTRANVMRWMRARPDFAAAVEGARIYGGFERHGRPRGYAGEAAERIYLRLCAGEPLREICRDPTLPSRSSVHNWMRADPELAEDLAFGRETAAGERAIARWTAWGHDDP